MANDKLEWKRSNQELPRPDDMVWVAVRNKNKEDGIMLYDICWHDGNRWGRRYHTWEEIVYWAYPVSPEGK